MPWSSLGSTAATTAAALAIEPATPGQVTWDDPPIHRPGQAVFFEAVVRQAAGAAFSFPPAGTTLTARLRDARQTVVRTVYLFTNEFGTVSSLFRLADGMMLGDYAIELAPNSESFRQTIEVQDYRKPDYPRHGDHRPGQLCRRRHRPSYCG